MNKKLYFTNEIFSAVALSKISPEDKQAFIESPKDFILRKTKCDLGDIDINTAMNDADEIHLILPYYTAIEEAKTQPVSDTSMQDVIGGEIMASLTAGVFMGATFMGGAVLAGITSLAIHYSLSNYLHKSVNDGENISLDDYLLAPSK